MGLRDYKVLMFDVYGTLIDWETGMLAGLKPLIDRVATPLSQESILAAHAFHDRAAQRSTPSKRYCDLLATVYRRLAEEWGVEVSYEECAAYGLSVRQWPAFEDSRAALQYLKQHYKLVVLTNTDNVSFSGSNARLGVTFDGVFTAEDVGSYKPSERNFEYAFEMLSRRGIEKKDILHTAESMFHDHEPGNRYGLDNCWIWRRHEDGRFGAKTHPDAMPTTTYRFPSMAKFVEAHKAEMAAG